MKAASRFMTLSQIRHMAKEFGTPVYVYDEKTLIRSCQEALSFPHHYGLTVRYAMKSGSNAALLKIFQKQGLHIDASSGYEVERALSAGIEPQKIQLTAQELPQNLEALLDRGILFNACSLHQLETYGKIKPHSEVSIRINPGLGSGHSNRTNVGGHSASFGIWHEWIPEIKKTAKKYHLMIHKLHTHIGSGTDPLVWKKVALMSLESAKSFEQVTSLNLGGGFKIARMPDEKTFSLKEIGEGIAWAFENFYKQTDRKLALEIEPGTYLIALSGAIITSIMDIVNTGSQGYTFYKIDSGMTEIARPTLYGSLHPIIHIPRDERKKSSQIQLEVIVAGHCCESGDILTPAEGNPEGLCSRLLPKAQIGDYLIIEGTGAYCSSMCMKNYNSFPESPEVLLTQKNSFHLIRKRQTLSQMIQNEIS